MCHLDWCDPNVEGLSDDELRTLDWGRYFNPYVEIDNVKEDIGWLKGADEVPRRRSPAPIRRLGGHTDLGAGGLDTQPRHFRELLASSRTPAAQTQALTPSINFWSYKKCFSFHDKL